jgi:hypothetical protein
VLVAASIACGCTSGHSTSAPGSGSSASSLECQNKLAPVTAPSTVRRLDHNVDEPDTQYRPPPPGDPAIDAIAALHSVQVHHAAELGNPLVATLVTMNDIRNPPTVTRVAWLLTVEDVPIFLHGPAPERCLAQTFVVDASTGQLLAGLVNDSSPVG